MIEIKNLPLEVQLSKNKKFILNMNNYRNAHYQTLNKAKKIYDQGIRPMIVGVRLPSEIEITYTYYAASKRRVDIANPCSIIDKFFSDSLVNCGCIEDDDVKHLKKVSYVWGGYDKENPRVDVTIKSLVTHLTE